MKLLKRMLPGQAGQALPMALIILFLGAMLIVPALSLTTTNLKATQRVDEKTREIYAADAGIEDALWYLQSETRLEIKKQGNPWPVTYPLSDNVNAKDVLVTINTAWLLSPVLLSTLPDSEPAIGSYQNANDHWTVVSALNIDVQPRNNYIVDITTSEDAEEADVNHIAVWLPQGYSCNTTSIKINGVAIGENALVKEPDSQISHRGGTALIWNYWVTDTTFKELSDIAPGGAPPVAKFPASVRLSFNYNATPFTEARGFFPWIQLDDFRIAWDVDAGFYHVESTGITSPTDNTTIEAYVPKGVMRYVSGASGATSAIKGDYIAIGNSLMTCCWYPNQSGVCFSSNCTSCCSPSNNNPYRNYAPAPVTFTGTSYPDAERESSVTVGTSGVAPDVPSDAKIERAYLYWTAWLRGDEVWKEKRTDPWQWDSCMDTPSNKNKWESCSLSTTPTVPEVNAWLEANAYDGNAYLAVNDTKVEPVNAADPAGTVIANTWYISKGSWDVQPSYQYSCFADVTAQVTEITTTLPGTLPGAKFTVAGVHAHPSKLCASDNSFSYSPNAGWSMIIIYSSAEKETHQIYLYAGCDHLLNNSDNPRIFTMTGFATPDVADNEAQMTVFASEGDGVTASEYLGFKGQQYTTYDQLYDVSNTTNVFNSKSSAGGFTPSPMPSCQATTEISGIDIDTYTHTRATEPPSGTPLSTIVHAGDTSANIKVYSSGDGFQVIYVVFSVRSTAVPAGEEFNVGTMMYRIE